jgi:hypothetical protein
MSSKGGPATSYATAGIALRVPVILKPPHHDKVEPPTRRDLLHNLQIKWREPQHKRAVQELFDGHLPGSWFGQQDRRHTKDGISTSFTNHQRREAKNLHSHRWYRVFWKPRRSLARLQQPVSELRTRPGECCSNTHIHFNMILPSRLSSSSTCSTQSPVHVLSCIIQTCTSHLSHAPISYSSYLSPHHQHNGAQGPVNLDYLKAMESGNTVYIVHVSTYHSNN